MCKKSIFEVQALKIIKLFHFRLIISYAITIACSEIVAGGGANFLVNNQKFIYETVLRIIKRKFIQTKKSSSKLQHLKD